MKNTILKIAKAIEKNVCKAEVALEKLKVIAKAVRKKLCTRILFASVRIVKPLRPYLQRSEAMTQYYFVAAFFFIIFVITQKVQFVSLAALFLGTGAAAVGFAIDTIKFVTTFSRKSFLVKLFYGSVTLAISYVALSASKHIAHEITQIDPKFFSEFLGFMTVVVTWFFALLAIQIVVGVWGMLRYVLAVLFMLFLQFVGTVFISLTLQVKNIDNFLWKLFTNRKEKLSIEKLLYFAFCDLVGSMAIVFLIISPAMLIKNFPDKALKTITNLLVAMEYRKDSRCLEANGKQVAYLDNNLVSTVQLVNGEYVFNVSSCEYKK
jgi:hypothetical protein